MHSKSKLSVFGFSCLLAVASMPSWASGSLPDHRHIAITGAGSISVKPDQAKLSLQVRSTKTTSLAAKQEVDQRVNQLLSGLATFAIVEKDVSASNILTNPDYSYARDNQREIVSYTALRDVQITLKNLDKLNEFLDYVLSIGINEIGNMQLESSNAKALEQQAYELAVKDAKTRASEQANAFGAKLGPIYSINSTEQTSHFGYGYDQIQPRGLMMAKEAAPAGQYLQPEINFSADISVVFDLIIEN